MKFNPVNCAVEAVVRVTMVVLAFRNFGK